jgi:hypothetical protein
MTEVIEIIGESTGVGSPGLVTARTHGLGRVRPRPVVSTAA